jgi:ABC-type nickel/cobalt efflux system permease component RcnA
MPELILTPLYLGFTLGITHAFDPDHLVAVSTLVSQEKNVRRSSLVGVIWGLGHTVALTLVGFAVLIFKLTIPPVLARGMELSVAFMIILLGGSLLWRSVQALVRHTHPHSHNGFTHAHPHGHGGNATNHRHHFLRFGRKPFAVGAVHGLAGSAALSLLVLTTVPSTLLGLLYLVVFGLGSVGGMLLMSMVMSVPFVLTAGHFSSWHQPIKGLAGLLAVTFGLYFARSLYP